MKTAKKRIGAVLVAACLMLSIFPTTAFAVTGSSDSRGSTSVQYTAAPTYTIDIPSSITITGDGSTPIVISCSSNSLAPTSTISVKVDTNSTLQDDGNFYLIHEGDGTTRLKCGLIIQDKGDVSATNCEILSCRGGEVGDSGCLYAQIAGTPSESGTYAGTIYFSITVE